MRAGTRSTYKNRVTLAIRLILEDLDRPLAGGAVASEAAYSRFHFHRLFKESMGETAAEMRRRVLLERAAFQLANSRSSVTEIGLDAGFDSPEAFTRAFRAAYKETPSSYRLLERTEYWLDAPNGVHFRPGTRAGKAPMQGEHRMDLLDRLIDHDAWATRRFLECASTLSDEQLDQKLTPYDRSLREMLDKAVFQKEMWVAAMLGLSLEESADRSVDGMTSRLDTSFPKFGEIARKVRDRGEWNATFVDAVCLPPETFSFGGAFAHVITHAASRREAIGWALKQVGAKDIPRTDPIDWEREIVNSAH